jgi:hypothetical protein
MTRAELIKERLAEIETELGAAPRRLHVPRDQWTDRWKEDFANFCAVQEWPARRAELIEERRRLESEYEHLPKHAKTSPSN